MKPAKTSMPLASFWLAAAESGYANAADWRSWADRFIREQVEDQVPNWIIDLSLADTKDRLWTILSPIIDDEVHRGFHRSEIFEAVLGYLWLRFERNDFDLRTLLESAGRHADAYGTSIECEEFYSLLNQLNGVRGGDTASEDSVRSQVRARIAPLANMAIHQWRQICRHD